MKTRSTALTVSDNTQRDLRNRRNRLSPKAWRRALRTEYRSYRISAALSGQPSSLVGFYRFLFVVMLNQARHRFEKLQSDL